MLWPAVREEIVKSTDGIEALAAHTSSDSFDTFVPDPFFSEFDIRRLVVLEPIRWEASHIYFYET